MKIDVIIPTYKPQKRFFQLVEGLEHQTLSINKIIIINTEEQYFDNLVMGTAFLREHRKLEVHHISKREYDHGKSRNLGASKSDADILVFMTQDAMPATDDLIEKLVEPLLDLSGQQTEKKLGDTVAVSYARQLPAADSTEVEKITRAFNYPPVSRRKKMEDLSELGIRTFFCSNVCAAYNRKIYEKLGRFINHTIFNEDMIFAANAVTSGYEIAYVAEAEVIHSHNYTYKQQFRRNFDLGVSQADHPEIFANISSESEGKKLVLFTIKKLRESGHAKEIPSYIMMTVYKYLGYCKGKNYKKLAPNKIMQYTMNPNYWKKL